MKKFRRLTLITICLVILLAPTAAMAKPRQTPLFDDKVIFGGTFTLESGETISGDLAIFGGVVNLLEGSTVTGDVALFGGNLTVDGTIHKNLVSFGGVVELGDTAVVRGDLVAPGTVLRRAEGAVIGGDVFAPGQSLDLDLPEIPAVPEVPELPEIEIPQPVRPSYRNEFYRALAPVTNVFWFMFRTFAFSAVAVLVMLIVPQPTLRISRAVVKEPVVSGGLGVLTVFTACILTLIYAISMVLILPILLLPVALLGWLVIGIGMIFGWIAVGQELGRRIAESLDRTWTPELQAGIGVFALTFLIGSFSIVLWGWIGGVLGAVVASIGLGSVLLTRFGSREYVPSPAGGAGGLVEAPQAPPDDAEPRAKPEAKPKTGTKTKAKSKAKSKAGAKTPRKTGRKTSGKSATKKPGEEGR